MSKVDLVWKVGKTYLTKGKLHAQITKTKPLPIPKESSKEDIERLLSKPYYGIEGFVFLASNPKARIHGSWTFSGKHSSESGVGDLTEEEVNDKP